MKTVLFVCVHNSGRSKMAEAFFNRLAAGRAQAISAGTQPADSLNPVVVEAMKEAGIDIGGKTPQLLTTAMIEQADIMISMGCGADAEAVCPARFVKTEDWSLDDPYDKPIERVREIRDEIRRRIAVLVDEVINNREV